MSTSSLVTSGTPHPSDLTSLTKPFANQTDQACPLCNGQHALVKCSKFLKSSVDQHSEFIRSKYLCFSCFKSGHMSSGCCNRSICKECGRRHYTLSHGVKPKSTEICPQPDRKSQETQHPSNKNEPLSEKPPVAGSASSNLISVTHSSATESASIITNCQIIQVLLFHKDNPAKAIKVYALLDNASDTTFVTTQVQRELGIKSVESSLDLSTMLGQQRIAVERIDGLIVQNLTNAPKLTKTVNNWPHLQRIQDKIPPYDEDRYWPPNQLQLPQSDHINRSHSG